MANRAEDLAKCTGARGVTYVVEQRNADGSISTMSRETYGDTSTSPRPFVAPDRQVSMDDSRYRMMAPTAGMRVLVPNAGGQHQSPGSYGYTETTILGVHVQLTRSGGTEWRLETVAYGMGCWRVGKPEVRESLVPAGGTGDEGHVPWSRCSDVGTHQPHPMRGANTVAFAVCHGG